MKIRIAAALFLFAGLVLLKTQRAHENDRGGAGNMPMTAGVGDSRPPKKSRPETLTTTTSRYHFDSGQNVGLYTLPVIRGASRSLLLSGSSTAIATFTPILRDSIGGGCVSSLIITGRTDTIPVRLRCPAAYEGELGPLLEWMIGELNRRIPPK